MLHYGLVDRAFSHDIGSVAGQKSSFISWERDQSKWEDIEEIFVTDQEVTTDISALRRRFPNVLINAWTIESRGVNPEPFKFLERNYPLYDHIFTHDSALLDIASNAEFSPGGGVWIGGNHAGGEIGVHPKTKGVSLVSSRKIRTRLHRARLMAAIKLGIANAGVDVFLGTEPAAWISLRDYRFSVVFENYQSDFYFTEKLLNCFATGTVPIYLGAKKLDKFFDTEGVIRFNSFDELRQAVAFATEEHYQLLLPAVIRNFELALDFRTIEDFIAQRYRHDSKENT